MKIFLKTVFYLLICAALTFLTQIGGFVFLLSWFIYRRLLKKVTERYKPVLLVKTATFITLYLIATFMIVPIVASQFGRVPMPMFSQKHVRPVTIWTCLLNRNYVRPELKKAVETVAQTMDHLYPGTEIQYLDANLPFFDAFPLLPHLSHNDGCKLDLAFFYQDRNSLQRTNAKPAFSGYGVFEAPRPNEINRIKECISKGYWQYDFSKYLTFGADPEKFIFDAERTKEMVELFSKEPVIEKMFLEPHLKTRLDLDNNAKIRFHGCQAVRHDDHLHIQVKR